VLAAPAASAPSPAASINIFPWDPSTLPVVLDYSVLVSYGTPEQRFPVFLDTITGPAPVQAVRLGFRQL